MTRSPTYDKGTILVANTVQNAAEPDGRRELEITTATEIKSLFIRYVEAANQGNLDAFDELFTPEYVTFPHLPPGPEGVKSLISHLRRTFSDFSVSVERLVAEGDWLAVDIVLRGVQREEFMGLAAGGQSMAMREMQLLRVEGGRFAERRVVFDTLGALRQLGAKPTW